MNATEVALYLRDGEVPWWKKSVGIFAALYVVCPLDLIPDWIPMIGWLDDLGVLGICAWFFVRQVKKHAAKRALRSSEGRD